MNLIDSNTGYTLDKTLNCTYSFRTSNKNDSVIVNFGNGIQKAYNISSTLKSNYIVPRAISNATGYDSTDFILLNNEFLDDTFLFGFEVYGTIKDDLNNISENSMTTVSGSSTETIPKNTSYEYLLSTTPPVSLNTSILKNSLSSSITLKVNYQEIKLYKVKK